MAIAPVEILYVDQRRLCSYVEQITSSPVEKTLRPTFSAQIGTAGASLSAHVDQESSERRTVDAIRLLDRHLTQANLLGLRRPTMRDSHTIRWIRESCTARKVHVPSSTTMAEDLWFWYSQPPRGDGEAMDASDRPGGLCLMQDGCLDDLAKGPVVPRGGIRSSFSLLHALMGEVHADPADTSRVRLRGKDLVVLEQFYEFASNPYELLARWGCAVSDARKVQTLYRIRACGSDVATGDWSTFAYAIWIAEAP